MSCILNLLYILHSTVTGPLLIVSLHLTYHEAVCRMQSPHTYWTPRYRCCLRQYLGVTCSFTIPDHIWPPSHRWRATPILAMHLANAIAGVPQGAELLTAAADALSEEPPPFQSRASAFCLHSPGGKGATGGESREMELRPCVTTQGL